MLTGQSAMATDVEPIHAGPTPPDPGVGAAIVATLRDVTTEALHDLGAEINAINRANGWDVCRPDDFADGDHYKVPAVIALCHSELSEALEAYRHQDEANFIEEMADTVIRVIDCTHGLGMDVAGAIFAKLAKNRGRGHRHGGKKV